MPTPFIAFQSVVSVKSDEMAGIMEEITAREAEPAASEGARCIDEVATKEEVTARDRERQPMVTPAMHQEGDKHF